MELDRCIASRILWIIPFIVFMLSLPTMAQDDIPTTTGFGVYALTGLGVFPIETNLLATGPPLLGDAGKSEVESIFQSPESQTALAFLLAGEIDYTISKSRTQFYFGWRLEDILRLDVPFGLGVRQELPDSSILALSALLVPLKIELWQDPYIEGEERERTDMDFPGVRLRWGRIFKTGLELTATLRWYQHDIEKSGEWLIDQNRLDADLQYLLERNGMVTRLQALYRIDHKNHRFEPAIRYMDNNRNGKAMASKGYAFQLTYLYFSPAFVLDVNAAYGIRNAEAIHPVYDEYLDSHRIGAGITAIFPIELGQSKAWNIWASAEYFTENSKVDFFDSQFATIMGGLMWGLKLMMLNTLKI